ncbi:MAG TPA: hypothetical protein VKI99_19580 [Candidatus Dormibacteraeota bacterium]|nr:hypothetical protein [Candidatus Dormibacteraeota bacterium]
MTHDGYPDRSLRVPYPPPPSDLVRLLGFGAIIAVNRIEASIRTEVAVAC